LKWDSIRRTTGRSTRRRLPRPAGSCHRGAEGSPGGRHAHASGTPVPLCVNVVCARGACAHARATRRTLARLRCFVDPLAARVIASLRLVGCHRTAFVSDGRDSAPAAGLCIACEPLSNRRDENRQRSSCNVR
jgi:hypothetical protein